MKTTRTARTHLLAPLFAAALLAGCATTAATRLPPEEPAMHSLEEFADDDKLLFIDDPYEETFNRRVYQFNYYLDKYLLLPVLAGYELVTPVAVQDGVSNFFNNVQEIKTLYNALLQAKGKKAAITLGRFVTNTTLGVAGLFDVATRLGMERQLEDFGQTLGTWGVGTGPFLVIPGLGPKTARATAGYVVDTVTRNVWQDAVDPFGRMEHGTAASLAFTGLEVVDTRRQEKFRYWKSYYPFEYEVVRYAYKMQRELALMK